MNTPLSKAVKAAGGLSALSRGLDLDRHSIRRWNTIPAKWIIPIEHLTGVPREELRPDIFLAPRPKSRK